MPSPIWMSIKLCGQLDVFFFFFSSSSVFSIIFCFYFHFLFLNWKRVTAWCCLGSSSEVMVIEGMSDFSRLVASCVGYTWLLSEWVWSWNIRSMFKPSCNLGSDQNIEIKDSDCIIEILLKIYVANYSTTIHTPHSNNGALYLNPGIYCIFFTFFY